MQIWQVQSKHLGLLRVLFDEDAIGETLSGKHKSGGIVQVEFLQKGQPSKNYSKELDKFLKSLNQYESGTLDAFDDLSLFVDGTEFQKLVLHKMRSISPGSVVTYGQLAKISGRPKAYRAVATVCATNKIPLLIPCHRVVPADYSIGNYASRHLKNGTVLKLGLLEHENAIAF